MRPGGVLFIYDLTSRDQAYIIPRLGYRPHSPGEFEEAAQQYGFVDGRVLTDLPSMPLSGSA